MRLENRVGKNTVSNMGGDAGNHGAKLSVTEFEIVGVS